MKLIIKDATLEAPRNATEPTIRARCGVLGPFALAHLRVYRNPEEAMSFLGPMFGHIKAAGLGTASEIFDGDPPFTPNGCIAQAWTVGEILRAWRAIAEVIEKQDAARRV